MYSIYPWKHLRTHHYASSKKKKDPLSKVWLLALQKRLAMPLIGAYDKFNTSYSSGSDHIDTGPTFVQA